MKPTLPRNFPAFPGITCLSLMSLYSWGITCVFVFREYWYIGGFWKNTRVSLVVVVLNTISSFHFSKRSAWQEHIYLFFFIFSISLNGRLNTSLKDDSSIKFDQYHLNRWPTNEEDLFDFGGVMVVYVNFQVLLSQRTKGF